MHNHNLEIHIEEDIRMPNGSNPYLTQDDPFYFSGTTEAGDYNFELPGYQYQGMSPEIMSSLANIFTPQSGDYFDLINMFGDSGFDMAGLAFGDDETTFNWSNIDLDSSMGIPDIDFESGSSVLEGNIDNMLSFTNIFDPESLAATLSSIGGLDEAIRPGEVKALTPEMIEKTTSAYYNPYETAGRESLIEKLGKARGGVSTGGFAGSGARQSGLSGAERLYQGGYGDLLGDIMKMRGGATEDVLGTIYGWQELLSDQ